MALEPLEGLRVVDLFAGSGALGIEALSRGALRVDFVEADRSARAVLDQNLASLDLSARATVWPLRLPEGLARLESRLREAELILLDPPYGGGEAERTLAALGDRPLQPEARVVVEHHGRDVLPETCGALFRWRERRYGESRVSTYRVAPERPPA